jgi:hypothetical protein
MLEYLKELGIDVPITMAGFSGGFATLLKNKTLKWSEKAVVLGSGGMSANYITPLLASFLNISEDTFLGLAFFVGFGGLKFVEYLFEKLHKKVDNENKLLDDPQK